MTAGSVRRWLCRECGHIVAAPDAPGDSFDQVCDVPGCDEPWTCGTPVRGGYRNTCDAHKPERVQ